MPIFRRGDQIQTCAGVNGRIVRPPVAVGYHLRVICTPEPRHRRRKNAITASGVIAIVCSVLWLTSLWVGAACTQRTERWAVHAASGTQELHTAALVVALAAGRLIFTQTRTLSQIGPIGSVATSPPSSDWDFLLFAAGSQRERSWDRRWFFDRWNNWRMGDLGWYESAGGGSISRVCSIPLWLVIVPLACPGLAAGWRFVRSARRRARGRCVACGYHLGGSQRVCPECGRAADGVRTPAERSSRPE